MFLGSITSTLPWLTPGVGRAPSRGSEAEAYARRLQAAAALRAYPPPPRPPTRPSDAHSPVSTPVFTAVGVCFSILQMHRLRPTSMTVQQVSSEGRALGSLSPIFLGGFHCLRFKTPSAGDVCIQENFLSL